MSASCSDRIAGSDEFIRVLVEAERLCAACSLNLPAALAVSLIADAGGELARADICKLLSLESARTTRIFNWMERAELGVRIVLRKDRRRVTMLLSDAGWEAAERLDDAFGGIAERRRSLSYVWLIDVALRTVSAVHGMSPLQMRCLVVLAQERKEPRLSAADIAEAAGIKRTSAIEALRSLEAKGLAERHAASSSWYVRSAAKSAVLEFESKVK